MGRGRAARVQDGLHRAEPLTLTRTLTRTLTLTLTLTRTRTLTLILTLTLNPSPSPSPSPSPAQVFIGQNLDEEFLAGMFNKCLATEVNLRRKASALRFALGAAVACRLGLGAEVGVGVGVANGNPIPNPSPNPNPNPNRRVQDRRWRVGGRHGQGSAGPRLRDAAGGVGGLLGAAR